MISEVHRGEDLAGVLCLASAIVIITGVFSVFAGFIPDMVRIEVGGREWTKTSL